MTIIKKTLAALSIIAVVGFASQGASATCWNTAGATYNVDPVLLMAIGWQESNGRTKAVGVPLKDGNIALGLMQINTIHLPELKKFGIQRHDLFDACTSVTVGAKVLRDCLDAFNQDTWRSVGCYYGGKYSKAYTAMSKYSKSVEGHYKKYNIMFRGQRNYDTAQTTVQPQIKSIGVSNIERIFFD